MKDLFTDITIDETESTRIINIVSRVTGVNYSLMRERTRNAPIVVARHTAMYLIRLNNESMTLKSIGKLFGDRDHTTVRNAIIKVEDRMDTNKKFKVNIQTLWDEINPIMEEDKI